MTLTVSSPQLYYIISTQFGTGTSSLNKVTLTSVGPSTTTTTTVATTTAGSASSPSFLLSFALSFLVTVLTVCCSAHHHPRTDPGPDLHQRVRQELHACPSRRLHLSVHLCYALQSGSSL